MINNRRYLRDIYSKGPFVILNINFLLAVLPKNLNMIYVGRKPSFIFKTRKSHTSSTISCTFSDGFCVLLYSNNTCLIDDVCNKVCFIVPVHFPSFIFKFTKERDFIKGLDDLFLFENEIDKGKALEYAKNIEDKKLRKINFL
jgi:hypothetical protein